jgi:hypothetical protein
MIEKLAPSDRFENGPFDIAEIGLLTPYLDFGSLRVAPTPGVQVRADIEDASKRVVAITLEIDGHRIQLQAFAASKTEGLWGPTIAAIESSVASQGGQSERQNGALGIELRSQIAFEEDGKKVFRESRFIGVDGPRWFLRGVMTGSELYTKDRYDSLIAAFRTVAVSRGDVPMPPGELLPLQLPGIQV